MRAIIRWLVALSVVWVISEAEARSVNEVWRHPGTGHFYALPTFADSSGRAPAIHISDDNGQSWSRLPGVPDSAGGELDVKTFAIIPDIAGADVLLAGTASNGLFRSVDSGTTWSVWNDAAIGIDQISVADHPGEASWAVASDGSVFVSLDDGANWTLVSEIAGITATAITNSGGDSAWVGTDTGDLIELTTAGTTATFLTGTSPFGGEITALARTADGTLYLGVEVGDHNGSHLYRTNSADLMTFTEVQRDSNSIQLRGLAAVGNNVHLIDFLEGVISVPAEAIDYLVTNDKGASYTGERAPQVLSKQMYVSPCDGCDPWVFIAHAEGLYLKAREGIGWNVLAAVDEPGEPLPPPPEPVASNADLSLRMVSPSLSVARIARSTSRYELSVSNNGPDDVSGLLVEIEFATWVDVGSVITPTSSWGESATIAGQNCEQARDSFSDEILRCRLDSLASGESASIILIQNLRDKTFQIRIDAEVSASLNTDPNAGNDWIAYEPQVDTDPTNLPASVTGDGGGGSAGLLALLGLLAAACRRLQIRSYSYLLGVLSIFTISSLVQIHFRVATLLISDHSAVDDPGFT
jgi:photosystem II stability/assembly factor-like uncharacterized protein